MIDVKNIAILGSTGSIGTQTLDIIRRYPQNFRVKVLTANNNWELLSKQALEFTPEIVVIGNEKYYQPLKDSLSHTEIQIMAGEKNIIQVAAHTSVNMVVTAMVGYSGLLPTINAINSGKKIALANKETLVVAGDLITSLLKTKGATIIPVDSEHSAIFQCLVGESHRNLKKILLTASGGPFRKLSIKELENVSVKQALNHPNWKMGPKVTIDSASMMNKGFEMIEAKWLFNCQPSNIEILVHPQSIVHSMVEFSDGAVKAQIGTPDMRLPIQYALSYPERLFSENYEIDWTKTISLTFEKPDYNKFPMLSLAYEAINQGGNMPCILNAANEIAVKKFLEGKIKFTKMPIIAETLMKKIEFIPHPNLQDLIQTNEISRKKAEEWIKIHC